MSNQSKNATIQDIIRIKNIMESNKTLYSLRDIRDISGIHHHKIKSVIELLLKYKQVGCVLKGNNKKYFSLTNNICTIEHREIIDRTPENENSEQELYNKAQDF